jgi:hypothetical protein
MTDSVRGSDGPAPTFPAGLRFGAATAASASGYDKRFGIVHVDYATQRRTIKRTGPGTAT